MVAVETTRPTPQEVDSPHFSLDTALYIPGRVLSNDEIASWDVQTPGGNPLTAEAITNRTGIERRFIAKPHETPPYMAEKVISTLDNPYHADVLLVSSSYPTGENISRRIKENLSLPKVRHHTDIHGACSGFVYALTYLKENEEKFNGKNIIVATSDVYHPTLHDLRDGIGEDPSLAQTIFSDGATAMQFRYGTDLTVLSYTNQQFPEEISGCLRMPIDPSLRREPYLSVDIPPSKSGKLMQDGKEVFRNVVSTVPQLIEQTIEAADIPAGKIKYIIPHQGSRHIVQALEHRLPTYTDRVVHDYADGNFSAGSIPKAMMGLMQQEDLRSGDTIVLAGFGAGLFASVAVVRLGPEK